MEALGGIARGLIDGHHLLSIFHFQPNHPSRIENGEDDMRCGCGDTAAVKALLLLPSLIGVLIKMTGLRLPLQTDHCQHCTTATHSLPPSLPSPVSILADFSSLVFLYGNMNNLWRNGKARSRGREREREREKTDRQSGIDRKEQRRCKNMVEGSLPSLAQRESRPKANVSLPLLLFASPPSLNIQ